MGTEKLKEIANEIRKISKLDSNKNAVRNVIEALAWELCPEIFQEADVIRRKLDEA